MKRCAHCGAALETGDEWLGVLSRHNITGLAATIVTTLMRARRPMSSDALIDALWGHDPNGGPDSARVMVYVYVSRLKAKLGSDAIISHRGLCNRPRGASYSPGPSLLALFERGRAA